MRLIALDGLLMCLIDWSLQGRRGAACSGRCGAFACTLGSAQRVEVGRWGLLAPAIAAVASAARVGGGRAADVVPTTRLLPFLPPTNPSPSLTLPPITFRP